MNITEIRDDMIQVYQALRNGSMKKTEADALANVAGKMIASAKLQLEYSAMRGEKPLIPFIGDGARPAINEPDPVNGIELKP